ncbi:MAG: MerR family transcriptional regulator [Frankiaceae bacterium]|jgi:DNA-binding transcriptional MerR regulator|nr:MerR family transcriptional regulator [Frankiaceae bacterium]
MQISELAARTGVPVTKIKHYLREGLLPDGVLTSQTRATYDERHVARLRVIQALTATGATLTEAREVLRTLDEPESIQAGLLSAVHAAITPRSTEDLDLSAVETLLAGHGWQIECCDPLVLGGVAVALANLKRADFDLPEPLMTTYLDALQQIARAELAAVPTETPEAAVRYVVLGTVLVEPLILALRRVAEQIAAADRFAPETDPAE